MAQSNLQIIIEAQNQAQSTLDKISRQLKELAGTQDEVSRSSENAGNSWLGFTTSISAGVLIANTAERAIYAIGDAMKNIITDSVGAALGVERMQAVLPILAKNTGKTTDEINRIVQAIREENKSILEATEITKGIVIAGLSETEALKLVTMARDVGATVGKSSADVNRLILESYQTMLPGLLKQVGINISLRRTYEDLAEQLGVNQSELTTMQRQQGILNAIFEEGEKFAGAYDAAMGTTLKVSLSVKDAFEDVKFVLGSLLSEGFFPIVSGALDAIRAFRAWAITSENELRPELVALSEKIGAFVEGAFGALITALNIVVGGFQRFWDLLSQTGIILALITAFQMLGWVWNNFLLPALKYIFNDTENLKWILGALFMVIAVAIVGVLAPFALILLKITALVIGLIAAHNLAIEVLTWFFLKIIEVKNVVIFAFTLIRDTVVSTITGMIQAVKNFFSKIQGTFFEIGVILGIFNDSLTYAREYLTQNFGQMGSAIFNFATLIREVFDGIKLFLANIWQDIVGIAFSALDKIVEKIKNVINAIKNIPSNIGGGISSGISAGWNFSKGIVGLAEGGIVTRPTPAIVGESGAEAIIPLNRLGALGGANITININGSVFSDDADKLAKQIGDTIIKKLGLNIKF